MRLQVLKERCFARFVVFLTQPLHRVVQQRSSPVLVKGRRGRQGLRWLIQKLLLSQGHIQGQRHLATATFDPDRPGMFVSEKVLHRRHQEGAESTTVASDSAGIISLQKANEEALGQVLGLLRAVASFADESVYGQPVRLAKAG